MPCLPANSSKSCKNYDNENKERATTKTNVEKANAVYKAPTVFSETFKFSKTEKFVGLKSQQEDSDLLKLEPYKSQSACNGGKTKRKSTKSSGSSGPVGGIVVGVIVAIVIFCVAGCCCCPKWMARVCPCCACLFVKMGRKGSSNEQKIHTEKKEESEERRQHGC